MDKLLKFNNKLIKSGNGIVGNNGPDPYNPLGLPPYTIRIRFYTGHTPSFSKGTGVQISQNPNIWDLTYENPNWNFLFKGINSDYFLEILGANSTNVTDMSDMFFNKKSLQRCSIV